MKTKSILALFLTLVLIVVGYFLILKLPIPCKPVEKSIAVLPFKNVSPDEENT